MYILSWNKGIVGVLKEISSLCTPNITSRQLDKCHYNTMIFHDFLHCDGHDQATSFELSNKMSTGPGPVNIYSDLIHFPGECITFHVHIKSTWILYWILVREFLP